LELGGGPEPPDEGGDDGEDGGGPAELPELPELDAKKRGTSCFIWSGDGGGARWL
jgi:hypothetical protein